MDGARWERVQALFLTLLELPAAARGARLDSECGEDGELARDVLAMLEEDGERSSVLDRGAAEVASDLLGSCAARPLPRMDFGPYRIKQVLGEGGMGVVYLAERSDLESVAAIKVLRDAWLSPVRRERFAAEQRTLAQLIHPSIAQLRDAGSLPDGTPWFVMEYVAGVPLTESRGAWSCSAPCARPCSTRTARR
jgi:serine/threonine-protein kinase